MTTRLRKFVACALVGLACTGSSPALGQDSEQHEGYFNVRSATTILDNGVHALDARLQLLLSDEANAALNSGVPLHITLEIEVIRQRRWLPDVEQASLSVEYELEYRPLSQRYLVRNVNSGEQESFATLYSALNNLGRIQGLPIIDDALLDERSRYRLRLRALLSTQQYPAPLRMLFFWRGQWQLKSDWYEWAIAR